MGVKEFSLLILGYFSLKVVDKFVEDNLPNLHYKKVITFFIPFFVVAVIRYLYLMAKITNNDQYRKNAIALTSLIVVAYALDAYFKNKSKPVIS